MSQIDFEKCKKNFKIRISATEPDCLLANAQKSCTNKDKNSLSVEYYIENKLLWKSSNRRNCENPHQHKKLCQVYTEDNIQCKKPTKQNNAIHVFNAKEELEKLYYQNNKRNKKTNCCTVF